MDHDHDTYDHLKHRGANIILDDDHELFDPSRVINHDEFRALVNIVGASVNRVVHHYVNNVINNDEPIDVDDLAADLVVTVVHDLVEFLDDDDDDLTGNLVVSVVHNDEPDPEHFPAPATETAGSEVTP